MTDKKTRRSYRLSPKSLQRLEDLLEESECNTRTDIIERSLVLYSFVLALRRDGKKLISRDAEGNEETIAVIL